LDSPLRELAPSTPGGNACITGTTIFPPYPYPYPAASLAPHRDLTATPRPLCRGHALEKELLYGLAQYEKVAENLEKVVMVHTPYHDLVRPAKVATGEGEADPTSRAKRGLEVPLRSVRAEAAAALASAQATAAEAEAAQADQPAAKEKGQPSKKRGGGGAGGAAATKARDPDPEADEAAPKEKKPKLEGARLSSSAAKTLQDQLAKLRAGTPAL
jgi:hypothetical protein